MLDNTWDEDNYSRAIQENELERIYVDSNQKHIDGFAMAVEEEINHFIHCRIENMKLCSVGCRRIANSPDFYKHISHEVEDICIRVIKEYFDIGGK